jgi:hypothetical protein
MNPILVTYLTLLSLFFIACFLKYEVMSYIFGGCFVLFLKYRHHVKEQRGQEAAKAYRNELNRKMWACNPREEDRIAGEVWYSTW